MIDHCPYCGSESISATRIGLSRYRLCTDECPVILYDSGGDDGGDGRPVWSPVTAFRSILPGGS